MVMAAADAEGSLRLEAEQQVSCFPSRRVFHNFSFPTKSWGNHLLLRCVKLPEGPSGETTGSPLPTRKGLSEKSPDEGSAAATRPWNLRTRRAACYSPKEIGRNLPPPPPPQSPSPSPIQPLRLRSEVLEKGERRKFSISLSREEIEEDFLIIKGTKPPRRPQKEGEDRATAAGFTLPWFVVVGDDTRYLQNG